MENPLISIVTVTYNAGKHLEPTLKSVSEQSFDNYEHLIIDGGSTDGTLSLLERHFDIRRHIHSKPDEGIYHAMNRGLKQAKGKYVIFLNAGDRFATPDTLMRYAKAASDSPDIIYGDTVIVDEQDNILRPRHLNAPPILTFKSYLRGMLICHQAFMVRREIAPLFNRNYKLSADYDWCLGCIENSRLTQRTNLKVVTIHYLEGGISQVKKWESLKERFSIMRQRFGLLATLKAHIRFLPRAIARRLKKRV